MAEFSELIRRFDKIRTYVRDFYIYGFKTREDYQEKSGRTYDNERRRIESWFGDYIRQEYRTDRKKTVSITVNSNRIPANPLYHAWKSKSFTANDIMLHFFLLDLFGDGNRRDVERATDELQLRYQVLFDSQLVRRKLQEYEKEGIFRVAAEGRKHVYWLEETPPQLLTPEWMDAVRFFQGAAPFGFVGSTILDGCRCENDIFRFRHDFLVHTLEDEVLLPIVQAIQEKRRIRLQVRSSKKGTERQVAGVPLRVLVSTQTGRRYLCMRKDRTGSLMTYRLDGIRNVELLGEEAQAAAYQMDLARAGKQAWGVSFGNSRKPETVTMEILLQEETERHIVGRLEREGRGGTIRRIGPAEDGVQTIYEYTVSCWDASELVPWARTFIGRIRSFHCSSRQVEQRFWEDIHRLKALYGGECPAGETEGKS